MSSKNFLPYIIFILVIAMTSSCKKEASLAPDLQVSSASLATGEATNESDRELKVMTYNMNSGAESSGIWNSTSQAQLAAEVGKAFTRVQVTAPERIEAIAHQIDLASPDIVGLQEAALWRVGPPLNPAPAETIAYDFLQILLDRLAAKGKHYSAISIQPHVDVELTASFATTPPLDVRYTDRSVIIARTDLPTSRFQIEGVNADRKSVV